MAASEVLRAEAVVEAPARDAQEFEDAQRSGGQPHAVEQYIYRRALRIPQGRLRLRVVRAYRSADECKRKVRALRREVRYGHAGRPDGGGEGTDPARRHVESTLQCQRCDLIHPLRPDAESERLMASWRAASALRQLFEDRYGAFGPACGRTVTIHPGEQLASPAAIERVRQLCAAAHENGRAPRIKGQRSTSWAKVYSDLCTRLMATTLPDGTRLLDALRLHKKWHYTWNTAHVVLMEQRRAKFIQRESQEELLQ